MKLKESAVPVNNVGAGAIEGTGVGPKGEPGRKPKKKKCKRLRDIVSSAGMQ